MLEAGSGRILATYDAATGPLANRVLDSAFAVHSGEVARLLGRIIVMLAGLSLPALYLTGLWVWVRRRHRARRLNTVSRVTTASGPTLPGPQPVRVHQRVGARGYR